LGLDVSSLASKFLCNHHPFFVGDFGSHGLWHPLFPTTIEDKLGLLAPMVHGCIPSFEHFIGKQIE
jgi:hypothetical protein